MHPNTAIPIEQVLAAIHAVHHAVTSDMLAFCGNDQAIRYIRYYQSAIIRMQDALVHAMPPSEWPALHAPGMTDSMSSWTVQVYHQLDQLLQYLQKDFAGYLDTEVDVPLVTQWKMTTQLQPMLEALQEWMIRQAIHPELQQALTNVFARYMRQDESAKKVTYKHMHYLHLLMTKLMQLISKQHNKPQRALQELLHYYNLNCESMLRHYHKRVLDKIADKPVAQQLELLALILKRNDQYRVHTQFAYASSEPSLQNQVRMWLTTEITYLEKLKHPDKISKVATAHSAGDRIVFNMTVAELACLMQLAERADLVKTPNITGMLETSIQLYATIKNPTLNFNTMHTNYYTIKPDTLLATIAKLENMVAEGHKQLLELKKKTEKPKRA